MKRIITILCVTLLILTGTIGANGAEEKTVVRTTGLVTKAKWKTVDEYLEKGGWAAVGPLTDAVRVAIFEGLHPDIDIQDIGWAPYGANAGERLRMALASGTAPSFYLTYYPELGATQGMINEGLLADITDLVKDWKYAKYLSKKTWREAWRLGKCYGIPYRDIGLQIMRYRKDWFKEAGIFNQKGEPAPPEDWTWDDFIEIAKKLTDPKANRWGYSLVTIPGEGWKYDAATFAAPYVRPDLTGKYTWEAAFNLQPGVDLLQFYKDLVWKYKVAIAGSERKVSDARKDLEAGRAGMAPDGAYRTISFAIFHPESLGPGTVFKEIVGMMPYPKGPLGVRTFERSPKIIGFNPTLSKKELKAAFEWVEWAFIGGGIQIKNIVSKYLFKDRLEGVGFYAPLTPYELEDPWGKVIDKWEGHAPDYVHTVNIMMNDPAEPFLGDYGLWIPNIVALETALQAAISKVCTDPNADPKTELDKAANIANKTALNVKLKGVTKENMKNYYTALGDFYKKNFPKYYEEVYKELFEKYYKVW